MFRHRLELLFSVDTRSLALLRIGLGLTLLVDLSLRARTLADHYTAAGVLPLDLVLGATTSAAIPGLHLLSDEPVFQAMLFCISAAFALMLLLGYRTRLATVACWLLLLSLHMRNPMLQDAGDKILRLTLFWSMFLPLGATASLDARRRATPAPTALVSVAGAAILLQFAFIYLFAGLLKTGPEWGAEQSALYYSLGTQYWVRPLGSFLFGHPDWLAWLTPGVRAFEIVAPLLLFVPWRTGAIRTFTVFAFWVFQHSLNAVLELGIFPYICTLASLPLLPTWFWQRVPGQSVQALAVGARSRALDACAAVALIIVVWLNISSLTGGRLGPPQPLVSLKDWLRLEQDWRMYAPSPPKLDYRYAHWGVREDGTRVDIRALPADSLPPRVAHFRDDYRAKLYVEQLAEPLRDRYLEWLCTQMNSAAAAGTQLQDVELELHYRVLNPRTGPGEQRVAKLAAHSCGAVTARE